MSASLYPEHRNGTGNRDPLDDKMDQIRELLYGEFKRDSDARIALIEARVRELESGLHRKLDAIQERLEALSNDVRTDRTSSFEELSQSVIDLGQRIRNLSRG